MSTPSGDAMSPPSGSSKALASASLGKANMRADRQGAPTPSGGGGGDAHGSKFYGDDGRVISSDGIGIVDVGDGVSGVEGLAALALLRSLLLLLAVVFFLSPVLRSLTASYSSDTGR